MAWDDEDQGEDDAVAEDAQDNEFQSEEVPVSEEVAGNVTDDDLQQALLLTLNHSGVSKELLEGHFGSATHAMSLLHAMETMGFITMLAGRDKWTLCSERIEEYLKQLRTSTTDKGIPTQEQSDDLSQAVKLISARMRVSRELLEAHFGSAARATDVMRQLEIKGFIAQPEGTNRWVIYYDRIDAFLGPFKPNSSVARQKHRPYSEAEIDSDADHQNRFIKGTATTVTKITEGIGLIFKVIFVLILAVMFFAITPVWVLVLLLVI
jgi:hypothetical protein